VRFADVAGHEAVKELLVRAADRERVPHACLFHGPEGVGKRTTALAFLSYLVCRDRAGGDSCGRCVPCRQVSDGAFVDLAVIVPEKGYVKIDAVRDAMPRLYYQPLVGPWKCLLIDDAHAMTLEAANAALKTLEEPPSSTLFVLVTPTPDVLPRTVLSRCFAVPFGPVPAADTVRLLVGRGVEEEAARAAVARARGSPGRAIRLLDSPVLAEREAFVKGFLALAGASAEERMRFADGVASSKDDAEDLMDLLESVVQDVLLAAAGAPDAGLRNPDLAEPIRGFAGRVGPDRAVRLADVLLEWDANRRYSPAIRVAVDRLVLELP
jgi:DNA polymerase-3 subunit delta'